MAEEPGSGTIPGRITVADCLWRKNAAQVGENLVSVDFAGKKIRVNRNNGVADAFARLDGKLEKVRSVNPAYRKYFDKMGGTFVWRKIAGTNRLSSHSFGITLDLNPALGGYWRWGTGKDLPTMAEA